MSLEDVHLGFIGRTLKEQDQLNPALSRIGGSLVWSAAPSSLAAVSQPGYFRCRECQGQLLLVGQFAAGYGDVPLRLLHMLTCPGKCNGETRAWRVLRSTGPVNSLVAVMPLEPGEDSSMAAAESSWTAPGDDWSAAPSNDIAGTALAAGGDDWGAGVAKDDWGAAASSDDWAAIAGGEASGSKPVDQEIEALLLARGSTAAFAPTLPERRPPRPATAYSGFDAEDADMIIGTPGPGPEIIHRWPCRALDIHWEPPPRTDGDIGGGAHERELLERYLQSDLAQEDQDSLHPTSALSAALAAELRSEEAGLQAEADADGDGGRCDDDLDNFEDEDDDDDDLELSGLGDGCAVGARAVFAGRWLQRFQHRLARSQTQVARYAWGGKPLWLAAPPPQLCSGEWPPHCSCGAPRKFELQLLPTLLSQMIAAHPEESASMCMDWGTVVIYTCSADCRSEDPCEEFVVVQPGI